MFRFLLFAFITQVFKAYKFDCNEKLQIQVPNFRITSYFIQELYGIDLENITTFICSGSRFSFIDPSVLSVAANLSVVDLSNNNIETIEINNNNISSVDLKNNKLNALSSITRADLRLNNLNIEGNNLTSDSKLFKENIQVTENLNLSNNLLRQLSLEHFGLLKHVVPEQLGLSNNLITALDEETLKIITKSEKLVFCPQIRNVACVENTDKAKNMVQNLHKRAGAMDVSCLSMELPVCGDITVTKDGNTVGKHVTFNIKFPDLKKVYMEEGIKLKITSRYFEPALIDIKTKDLILNKFGTSLPLNKAIESGDIEIEIEEVADSGEFVDPLNPKIGFFIFKRTKGIILRETNVYIMNKIHKYKKIEKKDFKPSSVLITNSYQTIKTVIMLGCILVSIGAVFALVNFKRKRKFITHKLKDNSLNYMIETQN